MHVNQKGRTMLEMLAVIALVALIAIASYEIFQMVVEKAKARTLEQEIQTRVVQLRHQALTNKGIGVESEQAAEVRAQTSGGSGIPIWTKAQDTATFTIQAGSNRHPLKYDLCKKLMASATFGPNNNNACQEGQVSAEFVFPKFAELKNFKGSSSVSNTEDNNSENGTNEDENNPNEEPPVTLNCGANAHEDNGECVCNAGYSRNGTICVQCGNRMYKSTAGNFACSACNPGQTHNSNHTGCENCAQSETLGECGCDLDKSPNGNGGCYVPATVLDCGAHAHLDSTENQCVCDAGFKNWTSGTGCEACVAGDQCGCDEGYVWNAKKCVEGPGCSKNSTARKITNGASFEVTKGTESITCWCPDGQSYQSTGCADVPTTNCNDYENNVCGLGYYCKASNPSDTAGGNGTCTKISSSNHNVGTKTPDGYWIGENKVDWFSANSWCIGKGRPGLIHLSSLNIALPDEELGVCFFPDSPNYEPNVAAYGETAACKTADGIAMTPYNDYANYGATLLGKIGSNVSTKNWTRDVLTSKPNSAWMLSASVGINWLVRRTNDRAMCE